MMLKKVALVFAAIALSYDVSAQFYNVDGSQDVMPKDSPPRMLRRAQEDCFELAILAKNSDALPPLLEILEVINDNNCGPKVCFDQSTGSIATNSESEIVSNLGNFDYLLLINWRQFNAPMTLITKTAVAEALDSGILKKLFVTDLYAGTRGLDFTTDVFVPGINDGEVKFSETRRAAPLFTGRPPMTGPGITITGNFNSNPSSRGYFLQSAEIFLDDRTESFFERRDFPGDVTAVQYCYNEAVVFYATWLTHINIFEPDNIMYGVFVNAWCYHVGVTYCNTPSALPSVALSSLPSTAPTKSLQPSVAPSRVPSALPSSSPSVVPTDTASESPTGLPSASPSKLPSTSPSISPSSFPTSSSAPTEAPCLRWLTACDDSDDCCRGFCRRGRCRLFRVP